MPHSTCCTEKHTCVCNNHNNNNNNTTTTSKPDEVEPHPVKEQLPGIQYCVNSPPPWTEAIVLGFQHYFVTLGLAVLIPSMIVPQMGGGSNEKALVIQSSLFVSGISTFLQSVFGTRLPVVVSGSYVYVIPTISIVMSPRYDSILDPDEKFRQTMRGIQGAIIIASCFQVVVACLGLWRNVVRLLSPLSIVPVIIFVALGLDHLGFPMLAKCVEVGAPQLIIFVLISQYLPQLLSTKMQICERYSLLLAVSIGWLYALLLTSTGLYNHKPSNTQLSCRADRAGLVSSARWIYLPHPFQWGKPTFNAGDTFAMMTASLVSLFESTGTFYATARYGSATPVPPSVVGRGVGWLGIGALLNGLFGSLTGTSASVENAGLLALTKVGSRRVTQISAGFMIFFSILGKFGAVFASIPLPIVGAWNCILFGYVASAGLDFLQFCNLNTFRTKVILGFSFYMGISVPRYFHEYYDVSSKPGHVYAHAQWFHDIVTVIFMSSATVAAIVAVTLDCSLARGDDSTRRDNGRHWWKKFKLYGSDVRNDEFYGLPFGLDQFFPSI